MSEDPSTEQSPAPPAASAAPDAHVPREHLFALLYAKRDLLPTGEGEGDDHELVRLRQDLQGQERYSLSLAPELALGPETAARYWDHAWGGCNACRCLLLEDGPDARPPKTGAEVAAEARKAEEEREKLVVKFWIDIVVGTAFFIGGTVAINVVRSRQSQEIEGPQLQAAKGFQIDPLAVVFMACILIASWFLAEAYGIARQLWVDFTAWKRAVPVIGKRWAAKGKGGAAGPKAKGLGSGGAESPKDS